MDHPRAHGACTLVINTLCVYPDDGFASGCGFFYQVRQYLATTSHNLLVAILVPLDASARRLDHAVVAMLLSNSTSARRLFRSR